MTDKNLIPEEARNISAYDVNAPGFQATVASWIEGILTRAGEDALLELIQIGQRWHQIKEQYFKDDPNDAELFYPTTSEDIAIMEAADSFSQELYKDKHLRENAIAESPAPGELSEAIRRTIERLKDADPMQPPATTSKKPQSIAFPIDKVNANIWKLLERDMGGQIALAAESSRDKGKKELNIYYSIDFGELGKDVRITRRLEPFDKRVYIAVGALWAAGNKIITITQIYYAMGGNGNPAQYQIEKIESSLKKMLAARVDIDNAQESKAYNYPLFNYHGNLLPMEFITAIVNGQTVDGALHIFREPPLITLARERKQITTIRRKLLATPLNKTNENLMIEDYLLENIAHARNGRRNKKILLSTIYKETRITEKKQRQRAPEKIKRLLDFYTQQGHISGYLMDAESITLKL